MIHRIDRVNPDVDDRVIKPNEARMATNLRFGASTEDTNLSGGTLILGNTELPFTPPIFGTNKVVGVYADLEANCVYFAMYNSQQRHGIYRINGATNQVDSIIGESNLLSIGAFLNFQPEDNYDVSIAVIQGLLYWTDNVNEPRVVNIEKGIRTMKGQTDDVYVSPWNPINYAQVKRPPAAILDLYRIVVVLPASGDGIIYNLKYKIDTIAKFKNGLSDFDGAQTAFWNAEFVDTDGIQFSYYYVYDNNEESKLAPWSEPVFYKKNIVLQVPQSEVEGYLVQQNGNTITPTTVKRVVFVYRVNNDGVPCIVRSVNNEASNYYLPTNVNGQNHVYNPTYNNFSIVNFDVNKKYIQTVIKDITGLSKTPVSTDLAEQRFDSVPLLSRTNTIAQNRLNHGNYILDRNTWDGLKLSLEVESAFTTVTNAATYISDIRDNSVNIFKPGGVYEIGVELLDEAGRPIGVVANQVIQIPEARVGTVPILINRVVGGIDFEVNNITTQIKPMSNYDDALYNAYKVKYTLSGPFPSWAKYYRIVSSGVKNINYFHRGIANIYYWYQSGDGANVFYLSNKLPTNQNQSNTAYWAYAPVPQSIKDANDANQTVYRFKGYAVDKGNIPVNYSDAENLYIKIAQQYPIIFQENLPLATVYDPYSYTPKPPPATVNEYKITGQDGNLLLVETSATGFTPSLVAYGGQYFISNNAVWWDNNTPPGNIFFGLYYSIEVYSKKQSSETIFYQNNDVKRITTSGFTVFPDIGYAKGDCYISTTSLNYTQSQNNFAIPTTYFGTRTFDSTKTTQTVFRNLFFISVDGVNAPATPYNLSNYSFTAISMNPTGQSIENWVWQKGQPNIVNENQRAIRIDNGIIFSAPIVQGTQVNGLNQFNSLDFRLAPLENGPISSLVVTNATQREPGVMLAIGANGVSSFYYDAIQLTNVDGTDNVATTTTYLASQRPLLGQYGTSRPMSVTKTPLGAVYWWSDVVNDLIRYTNAGLERLGMTFSFANYLRRTYNDNPLLITWYDQVTDEINLLGKGKETSTFSERYKTFQGERSYRTEDGRYPERGIGIATKQFLFLEGKIWVTDVELTGTNAPASNFIFGSFKNPIIDIVTNESPAVVKRWNQIKVFGSRPNLVQLEAPIDNESYGNALLSSIVDTQWINRKGDWEVAIRRAENTEGGLLAGKLMESRIIYSKFAFSAAAFQKLNFIEVKSNVSIVQ
jgi:hypothetical protein